MALRTGTEPGRTVIEGMLCADDVPGLAAVFGSAGEGGLEIDLGSCTGAELLAAAALHEGIAAARGSGRKVVLKGAYPELSSILEGFAEHASGYRPKRSSWSFRKQFVDIGDRVSEMAGIASGLRSFAVRTFFATAAIVGDRRLLRTKLAMYYMEQSGVRAIPIIATLCWMLGVVLGFQAGYQLRSFAAEMFMPDLVA
ncbi:hypothetical protein GX411_06735, partial [Candidatus Fermentibacteria bacterium]|nr:hypothetical protein [Candidatus Fermentibacteria bacterium]